MLKASAGTSAGNGKQKAAVEQQDRHIDIDVDEVIAKMVSLSIDSSIKTLTDLANYIEEVFTIEEYKKLRTDRNAMDYLYSFLRGELLENLYGAYQDDEFIEKLKKVENQFGLIKQIRGFISLQKGADKLYATPKASSAQKGADKLYTMVSSSAGKEPDLQYEEMDEGQCENAGTARTIIKEMIELCETPAIKNLEELVALINNVSSNKIFEGNTDGNKEYQEFLINVLPGLLSEIYGNEDFDRQLRSNIVGDSVNTQGLIEIIKNFALHLQWVQSIKDERNNKGHYRDGDHQRLPSMDKPRSGIETFHWMQSEEETDKQEYIIDDLTERSKEREKAAIFFEQLEKPTEEQKDKSAEIKEDIVRILDSAMMDERTCDLDNAIKKIKDHIFACCGYSLLIRGRENSDVFYNFIKNTYLDSLIEKQRKKAAIIGAEEFTFNIEKYLVALREITLQEPNDDLEFDVLIRSIPFILQIKQGMSVCCDEKNKDKFFPYIINELFTIEDKFRKWWLMRGNGAVGNKIQYLPIIKDLLTDIQGIIISKILQCISNESKSDYEKSVYEKILSNIEQLSRRFQYIGSLASVRDYLCELGEMAIKFKNNLMLKSKGNTQEAAWARQELEKLLTCEQPQNPSGMEIHMD